MIINKRLITILIIACCINNFTFSQDIKVKELMKLGAFHVALPLLEKELETDPGNIEIRWQIATCYLETNVNKKAAVEHLEYALENGLKQNSAVLDLGEAYLHAGRYDDAIKKIEQYKLLTKKDDELSVADKYISFAQNAKKLSLNPINVEFENMGDRINSEKSDFFPLMDFSEETLIFTTNRRYIADWGEHVHDINIAQFKFGSWRRPRSVSSRVNTTDHEYLAGSSPDLSSIFIRPDTFESEGDIFEVEQNRGRYGTPIFLKGYVNNSQTFEEGACLTMSGDTLYFSSDRPEGYGGLDLYYSIKIGDTWSIPQNLGSHINTPYNESYPSISADSQTLYFASEGHNSIGGYDIFKSKHIKSTNQWSKPENMGYPINSTYDDYNISITPCGRYGYLGAVRDGGFGEYDIYKLTFKDKEPHYLTFTGLVAFGDTASFTKLLDITKEYSIQVTDEDDNIFGEYSVHPEKSTYVVALPPGKFTLTVKAGAYGKYKREIIVKDEKHSNPVIISNIFFNKDVPNSPK
jgi:hypothetical protein